MLPTHGPPLKIVKGVSPPLTKVQKKSLRGYGVGHNGWKKSFRGVIFTWKSMRGYPPQWFLKIVEGGYFGWKFTTLKHLKRRERWKISLFLFQLRVFPPLLRFRGLRLRAFPENIKPKFDHYSVKTTDLLVSLTLELKYHQIKLEEVFRDENLYIEEINVILGQIVHTRISRLYHTLLFGALYNWNS